MEYREGGQPLSRDWTATVWLYSVVRAVATLRDQWRVDVGRAGALRVLTFYAAQVRCVRGRASMRDCTRSA